MKYLGIFLSCFAIFFIAGFFHGRSAAESKGPEEYLSKNVRCFMRNEQLFLCYVDGNGDSIRYSLDSNKLVDRSTWLMLNEHSVSTSTANTNLMAVGVIVGTGGFIISKFDKIIVYSSEQAANKRRGLVVGILGAIAGYWSGFEYGRSTYEPDESAIPTAKMLADTNFWKQAEYKVFHQYCCNLQDKLLLYILTHDTDSAGVFNQVSKIALFENRTLKVVAEENRSLNSIDFELIYSMTKLPGEVSSELLTPPKEDFWSWRNVLQWFFLVLFGLGCVVVLLFLLSHAVEAFRPATEVRKPGKAQSLQPALKPNVRATRKRKSTKDPKGS